MSATNPVSRNPASTNPSQVELHLDPSNSTLNNTVTQPHSNSDPKTNEIAPGVIINVHNAAVPSGLQGDDESTKTAKKYLCAVSLLCIAAIAAIATPILIAKGKSQGTDSISHPVSNNYTSSTSIDFSSFSSAANSLSTLTGEGMGLTSSLTGSSTGYASSSTGEDDNSLSSWLSSGSSWFSSGSESDSISSSASDTESSTAIVSSSTGDDSSSTGELSSGGIIYSSSLTGALDTNSSSTASNCGTACEPPYMFNENCPLPEKPCTLTNEASDELCQPSTPLLC